MSFEAEFKRVQRQRDLYETVLKNIARGYWNTGREKPISVREYAREALDPLGTALVSDQPDEPGERDE